METPNLHVVMFPWFGFGHISPFIQLSNKLASRGIQISFFSVPGNIPRISSSLDVSLPHVKIISLHLQPVDGLSIGDDSTVEMTPLTAELLKKALDETQQQVKSMLAELKPQFVFHDFAQNWMPNIAHPLGIQTLFFSVFSAISTANLTVPARLKPTGEYPTLEDMKKSPPGLPSKVAKTMKTYQAKDFLYMFKTFPGNPIPIYNRVTTCMKSCSAIVMKSCHQLEGPYIEYVEAQYQKPVLLLGPGVPNPPTGILEEKWDKWLNQFPKKSVIFCSFGSETYLSDEQIKELVLGLELTGLPFFVVLNFVVVDGVQKSLSSALPEGFEERVKGKGVVHAGWVQQQQILGHESVGCFVNHSGLSSIIEALLNDCQLVLLPQKGDQFFNAKLVAEDMKAGVEINTRDEDGHFGKVDICEAVKSVMVDVDKEPGKSIRDNNEKWRKFLGDKEVHKGFVTELVRKLNEMASK